MKLFRILTPEIILYIAIATGIILYTFLSDMKDESLTDFVIAMFIFIVICTFTVTKINDKIQGLKKN
ncbi:hypothetical protein FUA26_03090 [Seonamhaeicola algicola]|uniref:Uncharacterized protein n=1 Tax=Seonamhaeicola algicola TaxID=1719036 RepID=A0A5C7AZ94_9FLAO|nr:hypothetical protein [Seonamhaeicola algicola]TXE12799.1 hypothetical protein FUA26_03090 [Seonamhaeicola algicola]